MLENASSKIHDAIHRHNPTRNPPKPIANRTREHQMVLTYQSDRKLCFVAKGIIFGLSQKYGEDIQMRETPCMHSGAERCRFEIQRRA